MDLTQNPLFKTKPFNLEEDTDVKVSHTKTCQECNSALQRLDHQHCVCVGCGVEYEIELLDVEQYSNELAHSYNTSVRTHIPFRIIGSCRSARIQNVRFMGTTSEYSVKRELAVLNKINNWAYNMNEDIIPHNVRREAAIKYCGLHNGEKKLIKRCGGFDGVLGKIIYNECINYDVPRKQKVIAKMGNIENHHLSNGDKLLRDLNPNNTQMVIPDGFGSLTSYVDQYFEKLNIKETKYKQFVLDLIAATCIKNIPDPHNNARPTTRCAGCIYILCKQLEMGITRDDIATECVISKSTFSRFVNIITKNKGKKFIKNVFKNYGIPEL